MRPVPIIRIESFPVEGGCPAVRFGRTPGCGKGFALVATLAMMSIVVVLVLGLLALAVPAGRAAETRRRQEEARSNAMLGIHLALARLQTLAGPDTRVTAPATLLREENPPVTGVWRSWEGRDHERTGSFSGRPVAVDQAVKRKAGSLADDENDGRFLGWLASASPAAPNVDRPPGRRGQAASAVETVMLVAAGSAGDAPAGQVEVERLKAGAGSTAWWVGGENQKARLAAPASPVEGNDSAAWAGFMMSNSVPDPSVFGMNALLSNPALAPKLLTRSEAGLAVPDAAAAGALRDAFHDFTPWARGLLTNTATGGWKKDLTLAMGKWDNLPSGALPFFQVEPGRDLVFGRTTSGDARAAHSMLYWWADYRGDASKYPIYQHGPVVSWEYLHDYLTQSSQAQGAASGGAVTMPPQAVPINDPNRAFGFMHRVRRLFVVARVHWVFSYFTQADTATTPPAGQEPPLRPFLVVNPVVTVWNPYNVEMTVPNGLRVVMRRNLPVAFRFTLGSAVSSYYTLFQVAGTNYPALSTTSSPEWDIASAIRLMPGETRVYSPAEAAPTPITAGKRLALIPGYHTQGGHSFPLLDAAGQPMTGTSADRLKVDLRFDTTYDDRGVGTGIYLDMYSGANFTEWLLAYRMTYPAALAAVVYPPVSSSEIPQVALSEVKNTPRPFASCVFGTRMASDTHLAAKGFVQSSPFVNYTAMGIKSTAETDIARQYNGTMHNVNSPFDYSFLVHTSTVDNRLPNAEKNTSRGYIVSGFDASTGLSRCVAGELPLRHVRSLGQLQHLDIRYENPIPPFQFNVAGNSDASPILPEKAVYNATEASLTQNLQYDDSYCVNHLLFDDWFVSSLGPEARGWSGSGGRDIQRVHGDWAEGRTPLPNHAYRPSAEARWPDSSTAFQRDVDPATSYRSLASRIEVDGMFNVNSTSVKAWRALLGHGQKLSVPYLNESATGWGVSLSAPTDRALTRLSVAGDVEAASGGGQSGAIPEAAEFTGYRVLTDKQLDGLADAVVDQVRQRGPFLSLSEFVNRQLSQKTDLALAGTLQAALNQISSSGSKDNPLSTLQSLCTRSTANPPAAGDAGYVFPKAAEGYSGYGLPGWTRQADVLTPLAPVLGVRDDTFLVRAYGEARSPAGVVLSRVWCEAVVQRVAEFIDPTDEPTVNPKAARPMNQRFGRRFRLVGFRWLAPDEV